MKAPRSIAITGLDTHLGRRLVERLLSDPDAPALVGIDLRRPRWLEERLRFRRLDLTEPTADAQLASILADERVDCVVHLAFRSAPSRDHDYDHELETIGSLHVMHACSAAKVGRLVVGSSTMLYGPRPTNPNYLTEAHPLNGHPDAHSVQNRVEAEQLLERWGQRHPDIEICVLRHCWVMGPSVDDPVTRYFERSVVPSALGYDPLLQLIHEDDLLSVFEQSALGLGVGVYNIVGRGVLPLSTLLALAGKRSLRLPTRLLYRLANPALELGMGEASAWNGDLPAGFFDYLRYLWVADGSRGFATFGEPVCTTKEAWISFVSSRRLRRYR